MSTRPLHLVVFGATGFTGRLVAEYLASSPPSAAERSDFQWGIAGRSEEKLLALRQNLGLPHLPILVADSQDEASLNKLCRQTHAVVTTVGPYAAYGMPLVAACVSAGTHYADLSGEVTFMRRTIDRFHREAVERGVRIVHSCGFDSIPSEMGTYFLQDAVHQATGEFCESVTMALIGASGSFSGGTFASLFGVLDEASADPHMRALVEDPFSLNPVAQRGTCAAPDMRPAYFDADVGKWMAPFVMASINTRIVRRGEALLDFPYGRDFCYEEATAIGRGPGGRLAAGTLSVVLRRGMQANSRGLPMRLLRRLAPAPGEGPDPAAREAGWFKMLFVGKQGERVHQAVLRGQRDPGYGCTSRMLTEVGILLSDSTPDQRGGVLTPRVAFGKQLLQRLPRAGVTMEMA